MTRIIAGVAKGRSLRVPDSGTRPTSDRVKESLFSMLEHQLDGFADLNVLDLYAGSGALGLEAASRGAARVLLVENSPAAVKVIRQNIEQTRLIEVEIAAVDVSTWARSAGALVAGGWDLIFCDPPYDRPHSELVKVLTALAGSGALAHGCHVVVERGRVGRHDPETGTFPWPPQFEAVDERTYGDTIVCHAVCYVHQSEQPAP